MPDPEPTQETPATPSPEPQPGDGPPLEEISVPPTPVETLLSTPEPQNQPVIFSPTPPSLSPIETLHPRSFLAKALESIQFRKRAKLEKIIRLATEKGSIKNDQVEKLLRVTDATATRYLSQLVKDGRLRRIGHQAQPQYEPVTGSIGGN